MRYLLDTHVLIWWWNEPHRLPDSVAALLSDRSVGVVVSAVSGLEIAIKVRIGRLPAMRERIDLFDEAVRDEGFEHLAMTHRHAVQGGLLPGDHRDPFDRVLAGQALIEDMTVVTRDPQIAAFGCKVLW